MMSVASKLDQSFSPRKASIDRWTVANSSAALATVTPLSNGHEAEILSLLSRPSLTNVIMSGFIRDNGLASRLNRGRFYACYDEDKTLTGVALIGHTILFYALNDGAIQSFAALAQQNSSNHLLMGERESVRQFWNHYAVNGESPRLIHPVLFMQCRNNFKNPLSVEGLRLANPNDLEQVVNAQAAMAFETSGSDPLTRDPAGFRERYLRRIEKNRVWVLLKKGRLVFKTDVTSEASDIAYLEGVYVSPPERGKGLGRTCLQAIGHSLLQRNKAIYLFVEQQNTRLQSFYFNLGFRIGGYYNLLYF